MSKTILNYNYFETGNETKGVTFCKTWNHFLNIDNMGDYVDPVLQIQQPIFTLFVRMKF